MSDRSAHWTRRAIKRAFGPDAIVGNLIWTATWLVANWVFGQALEWSRGTQIVVGIASLLLLAASLFGWRNRAARTTADKQSTSEGGALDRGISPSGDLSLAVIHADSDVPEEMVLPEWEATCEPISESLSTFGRGAVLSIESSKGEERDLRCIVRGPAPDHTRYRSVRRKLVKGPRTRDSYHWPGEFEPKPPSPWPSGYYSYAWSGDNADLGDDRSEVLARRYFHVDEHEIVTCHLQSIAESNRARWRTTYEFRRDPRHGPGVTLRVASVAGEAFAYFLCRVTNPEGEVARASPKFRGLVPVARSEAAIHYPGQFRGVVLMPTGQYIVEWYGMSGLRLDSGRILLDKKVFTLREGQRFV